MQADHISVVEESNTAAGYPELYYFKERYFKEKIKHNYELSEMFKGVELYVDKDEESKNF